MKFVLILMFLSKFDENALALDTVEGFTSIQSCQKAGQVFEGAKSSTAYRTQFVCVEVK